MSEPNSLTEQTNDLMAVLRVDTPDREAVQRAAMGLMENAGNASAQERDDTVSRLASLMPDISLSRAAMLAVICGALVELGAGVEPIGQPTLVRFSEAVQAAIPFVETCEAEAVVDTAPDGEESGARTPKKTVERFGERVRERMPDAFRAFASLKGLNAAVLAMLSRSKSLRRQLQDDAPLTQAIARLTQLGFEPSCSREMLAILDDEQVVVLHPALARGYVIRIAGIGNNFQLHTLLADALIGDVEQGWLPGERPSPEISALAKDAPMPDWKDLPTAFGSFNLWNWTGLRADGALPEGQTTEHWIWNEGLPADIVPFHGTRVILIGPAPYPRSWNSGRFFPGMAGELEVLRQMPAEEARDWLDRIARAPRPTPAGRSGTASDIADIEG